MYREYNVNTNEMSWKEKLKRLKYEKRKNEGEKNHCFLKVFCSLKREKLKIMSWEVYNGKYKFLMSIYISIILQFIDFWIFLR